MNQVKLTGIYDNYFDEAWKLYENSFPIEERRDLKAQIVLMKNSKYSFNIILEKQKPIGIIFWWKFKNFRYIEHLATLPKHRGKGLGNKIINDFIEKDKTMIILEVEPPENDISQRRIKFYKRIGFKLNTHFYEQPSLHIGTPPIRLLLMTYPKPISVEEVSYFVSNYHPVIYNTRDRCKTN